MEQRRKFSREFKVEAIRLMTERGARAASEQLGVGANILYRWKRALGTAGPEAFRGNGNRTAVEEENRQLRLENKRLREEAEILKKAAAYFAKHQR